MHDSHVGFLLDEMAALVLVAHVRAPVDECHVLLTRPAEVAHRLAADDEGGQLLPDVEDAAAAHDPHLDKPTHSTLYSWCSIPLQRIHSYYMQLISIEIKLIDLFTDFRNFSYIASYNCYLYTEAKLCSSRTCGRKEEAAGLLA